VLQGVTKMIPFPKAKKLGLAVDISIFGIQQSTKLKN
jgi:hypothetical protein